MAGVYRFGPFELDTARGLLARDGEPLKVPHRHLSLLTLLLSRAGELVTKDELSHAGWGGRETNDNAVAHAVWTLRKILGDTHDEPQIIRTHPGLGYRVIAPVTGAEPRDAAASIDALVTPYRAIAEGHSAIQTMNLEAVVRGRQQLRAALPAAPESAEAHIDLATACVLEHEAARISGTPDDSLLAEALVHAEAACTLEPRSGHAWSMLALIQLKRGAVDADALAVKAGTLDITDWIHLMKVGFATWGRGRMLASHRLKQVWPEFAGAYWLEATVLIARRAFEAALPVLRAGCALQDGQRGGPFNAVGLHRLHGGVLAVLGFVDAALEELARELAGADERHLYSRECCANTWYMVGVLHHRAGRDGEAEHGFRQTLAIAPGHDLARFGLAALEGLPLPGAAQPCISALDPIVVQAARLACEGRHEEAARVTAAALLAAPGGPQGWQLPIDPLINAVARPDIWAETFRLLHDRAA